uniref:Pyrokinin-4 n=1 Tax=Celatoblatta sp. (strain Blue Mountains) TaxID=303880 RepID=PPK4_CELBM|nr:RecName: Full=Pyrokinin-4; Short=Cel-PK-4; AltName: Full=YXPRL-amide [Celatoblatta sp. Blue Mountains]
DHMSHDVYSPRL